MTHKEQETTQILAVSVDSHEISKKLSQKLLSVHKGGLTIPLLEDRDHKVIDRYGLFNPDGRGWPHPTTYVIDKQGIVRWKFTEVDYRKRPSNEQILQELSKLS